MDNFTYDAVLVGGCGHVGLPLGLALAKNGMHVALQDISADAVDSVNKGEMPFAEDGADHILKELIGKRIFATTNPEVVSEASTVIVIIGTPVDEHQNPEPHKVVQTIKELGAYFRSNQLLVLRSTIYPGTTALIEGVVDSLGLCIEVAFCPERIAEGRAMQELFELPQIVSSRTQKGFDRASDLFRVLTGKIVRLTPEEAELAKLFTNTWRYIKFATANQLFMMAENFGLDYETIRKGVSEDYPRAADLPSAGFAAGPCLLKDTLQLAAFNNNEFFLGQAAINVNEGLPYFIVSRLARKYKLDALKIGILGMAFKGESDDTRSSLAYKLKRVLRYRAAEVFTTDPYVRGDRDLLPLEEVLENSDLLIIGSPHVIYRELETATPIVDVWGLRGPKSGL
ncbi:MAG: nucleotide sugar dehydrogenase [Actinobacteria bacterium]|nr:nucleotide sugar dehydrogenase [Actinomycetota bacterium]